MAFGKTAESFESILNLARPRELADCKWLRDPRPWVGIKELTLNTIIGISSTEHGF